MPTQTEIFVSILLFPRLFDLNQNQSNYIIEMTFCWIDTLINWSIYILIYPPIHEPTDLRCYLRTHQPLLPIYLPTSSSRRRPTYLPTVIPYYQAVYRPSYLAFHLPTYPPPLLPSYRPTLPATHPPSYLPTHRPSCPGTWCTCPHILLLTYLPTYLPTHIFTLLPTLLAFYDLEFIPTYLPTLPATHPTSYLHHQSLYPATELLSYLTCH